jgi:PPOX class probable F420-dependent enzyme
MPPATVLPPAVRALVEGKNLAHLATLMPDGAPHSAPVWVDMEGERVVFMTDPQSVKGRNIARDPRVALSITDAERPNVMASVRGRVVETIDGDAGWAIVDRLCEQYLGMPYPQRTGRAAYIIEPDRAFLFAP